MLWEICRSAGYGFWMVEWSGDSLGRPTFHGKSGVDYILHMRSRFIKGHPATVSF